MENSSPLEREADGQSAARNENGTAEGNQQRPDSDGAPSGSAQAPADLSQPGRNLLLHPTSGSDVHHAGCLFQPPLLFSHRHIPRQTFAGGIP